jgi:hypothetical protein
MLKPSLILAATSLVGLLVVGCTTTQERVSGAGAGALVGSVAGPPGAVVGAVGGAVVGPTVSNATIDQPRAHRKKRPRHY